MVSFNFIVLLRYGWNTVEPVYWFIGIAFLGLVSNFLLLNDVFESSFDYNVPMEG
jgi:hypothetical protein